MNRSRQLASACSMVLLGAWCIQSSAQQTTQDTQRKQQQSTQQTAPSPHNQVVQKAGQPTNVLVVGEVTDARNVSLAGTAGDQHRLLKVKPNGNERAIVVDIGVQRGELTQANFTKGDRIVAMGKPARINGRPVLFAASVAEMHKVGEGVGDPAARQSAAQKNSQGSSTRNTTDQSNKQSTERERTATSQRMQDKNAATSSRTAADRDDEYAAVIYLFTTDNLANDEYGYYDRDFVWTTDDAWYVDWNDTNATVWNDTEQAHYDMFGYDDAGEAGVWDW